MEKANNFFVLNTSRKIILTFLIVVFLLVSVICALVYNSFHGLISETVINTDSKFALEIIDARYKGDWHVDGGKLYKGDLLINDNDDLVDEIKELFNGEVTLFHNDTRVSTTVTKDGERQVGTKASEVVIQEVLMNGKEYLGSADVLGVEYTTKYIPLTDENEQIVGMFFIGFPETYIISLISTSIIEIIILAVVLVIVVTILYNILIKINIVKPLAKMSEHFEKIASGDFTTEISSKYLRKKDEFGQIYNVLKDMQNSLKEMIMNINKKSSEVNANSETLAATSQEMSSSSQELALTMQNVAEGASNQANDLTNIISSLSVLTDNIENVSKELENVVRETETAESKTNKGKQQMDVLVKSIDDIKVAFELVVGKVETLTNSVKEISGITDIISSISEQTNLLALNAAIEAARAGEAGRGFAVVADEVRKLAEESKQSNEKIVNLIYSINKDTDEVINTSKNVGISVDQQTRAVENTVNSFNEILTSVNNIVPLMNNTSNAMDLIVESKDMVMEKVQNVNTVIEENLASSQEVAASSEELTASSEEVAATAQNLSVVAEELMETINRFKV